MQKIFKNKKQIQQWLAHHNVENFEIVQDMTQGLIVNVAGNVNLFRRKISFIPVKFGNVGRSFNCAGNELVDLKFAPFRVGKIFDCSNNLLTSLEGSPLSVGESFIAYSNKINSFKGISPIIGAGVNLQANNLMSLRHCPKIVKGDFAVGSNKLTNMKYGPEIITGDLEASRNNISSLEFIPSLLNGRIFLTDNAQLGEYQKTMLYDELVEIHREEIILLERQRLDASLSKSSLNKDMIHKI